MKRLSRRDRRDSILVAAQKVFAKKGFHGTRAQSIAREARVSPGLLFRYFPSMRALHLAVMRRVIGNIVLPWPEGLGRATPGSAMRILTSALTTLCERDTQAIRLLLLGAWTGDSLVMAHLKRQLAQATARLASLIRAWVRKGAFPTSLNPAAHAWAWLTLMLHGILEKEIFGAKRRPLTPERLAEFHVCLLLPHAVSEFPQDALPFLQKGLSSPATVGKKPARKKFELQRG